MDDDNGSTAVPINETTTSSEEHIHETTSPPHEPPEECTSQSPESSTPIPEKDDDVHPPVDPAEASDEPEHFSQQEASSAETVPDGGVAVDEIREPRSEHSQEDEGFPTSESSESVAITLSPRATDVGENSEECIAKPQLEGESQNEDHSPQSGEIDPVVAQDEPLEERNDDKADFPGESEESDAIAVQETNADDADEEQELKNDDQKKGEEHNKEEEQIHIVAEDSVRTKHKINGNLTTSDSAIVVNESERSVDSVVTEHEANSAERSNSSMETIDEKPATGMDPTESEVDETLTQEDAPRIDNLETSEPSPEKCENMEVDNPCEGSRIDDVEMSETPSDETPDVVLTQPSEDSDQNMAEKEQNNQEDEIETREEVKAVASKEESTSECDERK